MITQTMCHCLLIISGFNDIKSFRMINFQVHGPVMRSHQNELGREGFAYNPQGLTHRNLVIYTPNQQQM